MIINELDSALHMLLVERYEQVAHINLSTKTCEVLWTRDSTSDEFSIFYIDRLWNSAKLYPSDVKILRKLHNIEFIRKNIAENSSLCCKFRQRKVSKSVEWMQIEVVKSLEYDETNVDLLMFVKNIEDSYGREYKAKKEAERLAKTDILTGFYNRLAFNTFCNMKSYNTIGVVYVDLNCLKNVNDTRGHEAGDDYIKQCCLKMSTAFTNYKKYRVGGDEFVIIAPNAPVSEFVNKVDNFSKSVSNENVTMPMCSIGYKWTNCANVSIDKIVKDAERDMYIHKEEDYLRYHTDRRHNS